MTLVQRLRLEEHAAGAEYGARAGCERGCSFHASGTATAPPTDSSRSAGPGDDVWHRINQNEPAAYRG